MPALKGSPKHGGRKKGTKNKKTPEIKQLLDKIVDFPRLLGKLQELSDGIQIRTIGGDGIAKIYDKGPDAQAAKILLEYRFGKPSQAVDLTTKGDSLNQRIIIQPVGAMVLAKTESEVDIKRDAKHS